MSHTITKVLTPQGRPARFKTRDGTSDLATVGATNNLWGKLVDEYHLPYNLSGWALDVGAHIGSVTVPLLLDNPELRVVAIEAVPPNVELLSENLNLNGVYDRCTIINGAAWKASGVQQDITVEYGYTGSEVAETHQFIGSITPWMDAPGEKITATVRLVSLKDAIAYTGGVGFVWVKIDCEGAEHYFLRGPGLKKLGLIEGEWHERDGTPESFAKQLEKTHLVDWQQGIGGGPFRAVPR